MANDIDNYFENMGETLVRTLSRNWSGDLRADAQRWLAARAREAQFRDAPASAPLAPRPVIAGERPATRNSGKSAMIAPAVAVAALVANIVMVAYLIH
jgi:hypothetical protein